MGRLRRAVPTWLDRSRLRARAEAKVIGRSEFHPAKSAVNVAAMKNCPKSPRSTVGGMMYFGRMLDKIRLRARGELPEEYHANLGVPRSADGVCLNFLRINYDDLKKRVMERGTDEEILEWA